MGRFHTTTLESKKPKDVLFLSWNRFIMYGDLEDDAIEQSESVLQCQLVVWLRELTLDILQPSSQEVAGKTHQVCPVHLVIVSYSRIGGCLLFRRKSFSQIRGNRMFPQVAHRCWLRWIQVVLEPASFTEEKYALYQKYQLGIHQDKKNTESGFKRFLVDSPLNVCHSDCANSSRH